MLTKVRKKLTGMDRISRIKRKGEEGKRVKG
jgi:hypothetical protein